MAIASIWGAASLSFGIALVHVILGGRDLERPFRQTRGMDHTVMATMWMCWHMVTATIVVMGGFFVVGALVDPAYALAGAAVSAGMAVAGVGAKIALGTSYAVLPQGWFFVSGALLGAYGVWG